jgi:hypothetical protein
MGGSQSQEIATTVCVQLPVDRLRKAIEFLIVGFRASQNLLHLDDILLMALCDFR